MMIESGLSQYVQLQGSCDQVDPISASSMCLDPLGFSVLSSLGAVYLWLFVEVY